MTQGPTPPRFRIVVELNLLSADPNDPSDYPLLIHQFQEALESGGPCKCTDVFIRDVRTIPVDEDDYASSHQSVVRDDLFTSDAKDTGEVHGILGRGPIPPVDWIELQALWNASLAARGDQATAAGAFSAISNPRSLKGFPLGGVTPALLARLLLLTILEEKGFLRPWQRGEQTDIRVFQKIAICPVDRSRTLTLLLLQRACSRKPAKADGSRTSAVIARPGGANNAFD